MRWRASFVFFSGDERIGMGGGLYTGIYTLEIGKDSVGDDMLATVLFFL